MIPVIIFILLLILAVMALIRLIYNKNWHKGLDVKLRFADSQVREGDSTLLLEEISNRKNLPLPAVEIDFNFDRGLRFVNTANSIVSDKLYRRDIFALAPNQKITRRLELNCLKRGYYTLTENGLAAKDIFLSKKYVTAFPQSTRLYVFPEHISAERIAVPFKRIMGELLTRDRVYEDPFEFGGIRDYMQSDPMKYINWKASAKSGKLVVNLHDSTLSQRVCIFLDTSGSDSAREAELTEEAIRLCAALSEKISSAGVGLDIISSGRDKLSGEKLRMESLGSGSLTALAKALARLELTDESIGAELSRFKADRRTLVILISKNNSPEALHELYRLSGDGRAMWIRPYADEAEKLALNEGRVIYQPWNVDLRKAEKEL